MTTAIHNFEVEIDVSGTADAADESVGYAGGYVDLAVDALYGIKPIKGTRPQQWRRFDLLAGLDDAAKAHVLANIQNHVGEDAMVEALSAEAGDDDRADYMRDQEVDRDADAAEAPKVKVKRARSALASARGEKG